MVNPTEIVGISGALVGLTVCVVLLGVYWFFLWKKREPKSPDYQAVGDFKPSEVFCWDSSASITKSLQEVTVFSYVHGRVINPKSGC